MHADGRGHRRQVGFRRRAPQRRLAAKKYPNLLKECDVLTEDILAQTVGADPLDIQSTFVGAVCRWQAANPAGLIDITRFWFEQGSLDNERKAAEQLKYQIENRSIAGIESFVMRPNDPNGACGVASDAAGVVGWWVNPQVTRHRRVRDGDQADGADPGHPRLARSLLAPKRTFGRESARRSRLLVDLGRLSARRGNQRAPQCPTPADPTARWCAAPRSTRSGNFDEISWATALSAGLIGCQVERERRHHRFVSDDEQGGELAVFADVAGEP